MALHGQRRRIQLAFTECQEPGLRTVVLRRFLAVSCVPSWANGNDGMDRCLPDADVGRIAGDAALVYLLDLGIGIGLGSGQINLETMPARILAAPASGYCPIAQ